MMNRYGRHVFLPVNIEPLLLLMLLFVLFASGIGGRGLTRTLFSVISSYMCSLYRSEEEVALLALQDSGITISHSDFIFRMHNIRIELDKIF